MLHMVCRGAHAEQMSSAVLLWLRMENLTHHHTHNLAMHMHFAAILTQAVAALGVTVTKRLHAVRGKGLVPSIVRLSLHVFLPETRDMWIACLTHARSISSVTSCFLIVLTPCKDGRFGIG